MVAVESLYQKYGSRITSGVSELFYDRVYADPTLARFFEGIEINRMQEHMSDILSVITGGPDLYRGNDLTAAHAPYPITDADFGNLISHMAASIVEIGATDEEAEAITAVMMERREEIVT